MQNNAIPSPSEVKNFPIKNTKAKIVLDARSKRLRVVERHYYWDPIDKRGKEKRVYLGYVVDNVYYPVAQYQKKFKKNGQERLLPQQSTVVGAKVNAGKVESVDTTASLPTTSLTPILAAEFPVYYELANSVHLRQDLVAVWGEKAADAILSVAFHWLHTSQNAAYLYASWSQGKLLPLVEPLESKELSAFFSNLANTPGWRQDFFKARLSRLPEDEYLSYDATNFASESASISYAQFGHGKEGGFQKQVGLVLLVGQNSGMPVLFRLLPGQIADVTTVQDMLFRFDEINEGKRVFAAVVDRGYFSLENIAKFIDQKSRVIMAAKLDSGWVKDAIESVMTDLWDHKNHIDRDVFGKTVVWKPEFADKKERKVWVHVFRSETKSAMETLAFYDALQDFESQWMYWNKSLNKSKATRSKSRKEAQKEEVCPLLMSPMLKYFEKPTGKPGESCLIRNLDVIAETTRYFGCFCNISTETATARQAFDAYRGRDVIEKAFKCGKTNLDMDVARAHSNEALEGRFIVSFVALTILRELMRRMKLPTQKPGKKGNSWVRPLADEMSVNQLKNYLSSIQLVTDSHGNRRWLEVTQRQHEIAKRLGFPGLYEKVPDWGM